MKRGKVGGIIKTIVLLPIDDLRVDKRVLSQSDAVPFATA
jgi:hypothetical protein